MPTIRERDAERDSRAAENDISPSRIEGSVTPRFLNSMPNTSVAAACRKNSTRR